MKKLILPISLLSLLVILLLLNTGNKNLNGDFSKEQISQKEKKGEVEFESEHEKRVEEGKFDEPDKFTELAKKLRTKDGQDSPRYKDNYLMEEFRKAKLNRSKYAKTTADLDWTERGPANVGGRTRGLLVDPDDPTGNTWFTCSVSGGVWKTTDEGQNWECLTDELPALATTSIAMAETNHNIIYVGTGEGYNNADAIIGQGIFKSTDKGQTWTQLPSTVGSDFYYVNRLVVDPDDENVVIAATGRGIFKSIDGGTTWSNNYVGRTCQDLIANPEDFNTLYSGVSGLGVIKSVDAGENWVEVSDFSTGGRYEIAIAPTDTSRIYAANEASILFVSTDAGAKWSEVEETVNPVDWMGTQGWYDNALAVHPFNEDVVFMGGIDIWRADVTVGSRLDVTGVELSDNFGDVFAASYQGLPVMDGAVGTGKYYWQKEVFDIPDLVPVEIRTGPGISQMAHRFTTNNYVYQDYVEIPFQVWDVQNDKQLMLSFYDIDGNGEFNLRLTRGDILFVNNVDYDAATPDINISSANQGLQYKNIAVVSLKAQLGSSWDPDNLPETYLRTVLGQTPISQRSSSAITDGYDQYGAVPAGVHVDQHELVMIPVDEATNSFKILNGNDGGVGISDDGGVNWRETDAAGYNTTQFYGIDKQNGADEYFGGTQDNGTWQSNPGENATAVTNYKYRLGGDGFEVSWNYDDPLKMIGGSQYNTLYRTEDGWQTREAAVVGFDDWANSSNSPFISKVAESNSDPDLVFTISRQGVWRSDNYAKDWTLISIPAEQLHSGGYFSFAQVEISIADPQVVWAGAYMSSSGKILVSKDGGLSFNTTTNYKPLGLVSGISTDPVDPATAYATFSVFSEAKILKTTDYGQTWTDITGFESGAPSSSGFPDVAVYDVVVMPYNTNVIWAGTELGLFVSEDGGNTWYYSDNGLPAVAIWDMKIVNDQVIVGTHGRGIWSVTLPELSGYEPPVVTLSPRLNNVSLGLTGINISASLRSAYDSTHVYVDGSLIKTIQSTSVGEYSINATSNKSGEVDVNLISYKNGRGYKSGTKSLFNTSLFTARAGFTSDLNTENEDFFMDNLFIATPQGFSNGAIHSGHPYNDQETAIAMLRVPIIVADQNATLKYDDIAIVEKGDPGTVFGDEEFWDYVIVEGFNGDEWIPLIDGYDARYNEQWLSAYDAGFSGSSTMYVTHNINLLDKFSAGDTVLIRFRLFADQYTNGWGWAIDNVSIQDQFVDVKDDNTLPATYSLTQNYPNPFNPSTNISYSIPEKSSVKLNIYSVTGELVETLVDAVKSAGKYEIEWHPNIASGVYIYQIQAGKFIESKKMILLK